MTTLASSTVTTSNLTLRPGAPSDAQACGEVCFVAFKTISERHAFPEDFPSPEVAIGLMNMLFARPNVFSVIAERDGRIVGSNFLWEAAMIAGVGPITVDPTAQDGSIGRRLMEHVLSRAAVQKFAGVRLVQAGYHCRSLSLYTKLGFDVREPLACMQGPAINTTLPGYAVRLAHEGDVELCNALCSEIHGFNRGVELQDAIQQRAATVVEHNGTITGYATGIGFFDHAIGRTNAELKSLIAAAPQFLGPGFLLPMRNAELFRWCLANGLRMVQPANLMSLGLYNEPAGAFLPSILF